MFKVEFENMNGVRREIGRAAQRDEAFKIINNFLNDHNYKSYYFRSWKTKDNEEKIDYGSYVQFFYIVEVKE
jgi:hypothetical protein